MSDAVLREIRDLIQVDVNRRGLATDPEANLINACPDDFAAACRSIAETPNARLCVVTGFYIAHAEPPCRRNRRAARRAVPGAGADAAGNHGSVLATDSFCQAALQAGLEACGLLEPCPRFCSVPTPGPPEPRHESAGRRTTHLIALSASDRATRWSRFVSHAGFTQALKPS